MSETWWRTSGWGYLKITPVQVKSSTEHYVTLEPTEGCPGERREAKGDTYYKTFAEARTYHMRRLSRYIDSRQADVNKARADMNTVFMMEEPK